MVGVLLVTHSELGESFARNAEYIIGAQSKVVAVSQQTGTGFQVLQAKVASHLTQLEDGDGVLILVDIYGGTPSKVALSFVGQRKVAVVTGLNTAMLLKVLEADRCALALGELARIAAESARKSISIYGVQIPGEVERFPEETPDATLSEDVSVTVTVLNSLGLHASTSAKLVKASAAFQSEITLSKGDMVVNTKSIMGVLMLGAAQGSQLNLKATGPDAALAVETLKGLFATRFGEE